MPIAINDKLNWIKSLTHKKRPAVPAFSLIQNITFS